MSDPEKTHDLVSTPASSRTLTAPDFHQLAQVPPAAEWFANIDNPNTRRAYRNDLQEFMSFVGVAAPEQFRLVSRAHVLAWRQDLERASSPWLLGAFPGADIMFAPIATRFQTYGVRAQGLAKDYMDRLLEHPLVAEWLRLSREEADVIPILETGH